LTVLKTVIAIAWPSMLRSDGVPVAVIGPAGGAVLTGANVTRQIGAGQVCIRPHRRLAASASREMHEPTRTRPAADRVVRRREATTCG
jgi:hypothetical protein